MTTSSIAVSRDNKLCAKADTCIAQERKGGGRVGVTMVMTRGTAYSTKCWIQSALVLTYVLSQATAGRKGLIVDTDQGLVGGIRHNLLNQKSVDCFLGIPFAKPPVGQYRFQHPQPIERWAGIYNATKLPHSCYQGRDDAFGDFTGSTMWNPNTPVSEDCLYLNVWVPHTVRRSRHSAVLVWIFGGGFYSGSSTLSVYDGKILATENEIIVVSINYRLGAFGFLSMMHPDAPGNAGLFDQNMGLEWVQQNIEHFGGDPNNVTIVGESAGSVSVSLHLLSPLSKTKFQRAILQSGTANMPWSVMSAQEGMRRSIELANVTYCADKTRLSTDEIAAVISCLRDIPPQQLVDSQWVSRGIMQFPFLPIVDGTFLTETPQKSLQTKSFKKCDILLGSNTNEGSFFIIYELPDLLTLNSISMNHSEFESSMENLFHYYPHFPIENTQLGKKSILFQYSDYADPDNESRNLQAIDDAVTECHFLCHVNAFAQAYTEAQQNVYMYYYTQRFTSNPWPKWMGVLHADEILFTFGEPFKPDADFTPKEQQFSAKLMAYWSNFAKTGNPNIRPGRRSLEEWPARSVNGQEYLELNLRFLDQYPTRSAIGRGPRINRCAFWTQYIPQIMNETEMSRWTSPEPQFTASVEPLCPTTASSHAHQHPAAAATMLFLAWLYPVTSF